MARSYSKQRCWWPRMHPSLPAPGPRSQHSLLAHQAAEAPEQVVARDLLNHACRMHMTHRMRTAQTGRHQGRRWRYYCRSVRHLSGGGLVVHASKRSGALQSGSRHCAQADAGLGHIHERTTCAKLRRWQGSTRAPCPDLAALSRCSPPAVAATAAASLSTTACPRSFSWRGDRAGTCAGAARGAAEGAG